MRRPSRNAAAAISSLLALNFLAWAADAPDSKLNPQDGSIATVDAALVNGKYELRATINSGDGDPVVVTLLTDDPIDDRGPRLAISPAGDACVAWWHDASPAEVLVMRRSYADGTWSARTRVSAPGEDSRRPAIAHDGVKAWVAYEVALPDGARIAVTGGDGVGPWPSRCIVADTKSTADLQITIQTAPGRLWLTWLDSDTQIGWSAYDYAREAWSSPAYEVYTTDSIATARARIRAAATSH